MFLLFAGDNYYPSGGWGDFIQEFETLEGAKEWYKTNQRRAQEQRNEPWYAGREQLHHYDWGQIVNTENMEEIAFTGEEPFGE